MDVMTTIYARRSIRKFMLDPIDESDLIEIVRAGTQAANAENHQPWSFVIIMNKELIHRMADAVENRVDMLVEACCAIGEEEMLEKNKYFMTFFKDAPAVIAVFAAPYSGVVENAFESLSVEFKTPLVVSPAQQSIGGAIQNIALAAHEKGYGTTSMYAPVLAYREIGEILGVGAPLVLSALIPIGKPAQSPKARPRKELSEICKIIK